MQATVFSCTKSVKHEVHLLRVPQRKGQFGITIIGGQGYSTEKTDDGFAFEKVSEDGQTVLERHEVELWGPRVALCTCKDYLYRGRKTGQPCKHGQAARLMAEVKTDALLL